MTNNPGRCLHWGHHLLRQCTETAVFDGMCGNHFLSCGVGCPPVRLVWWQAVPGGMVRVGKGRDEYGNTSRYLQIPLFGTLIVFGGLRPLSHEREPEPAKDDAGGNT